MIGMEMAEDIRINLVRELEESPIIIEGLPGVGLVGGIAASFMIDKLEMELAGYVESRYLPPVALLRDGVTQHPFRIYAKGGVAVLYSDVPIAPALVYDLSKKIVEWASRIKAKQIITLAGIPSPLKEPAVYGVATSKEIIEYLKSQDVEILREGVISGMPGQVLLDCAQAGLPALCLLAQTPGMSPDPRGAAELIKVLNRLHGFDIDVEPLIQEAEAIEAKMEELAKQTRKLKQQEVKELPMFY